MNFFRGELETFDLCKMNEDISIKGSVKKCYNSISESFNKEEKSKHIEDLLKYNGQLYYLFAKRDGNYLYCINGEKYSINDDIHENPNGVNMSDAYINVYEDINLGFLISYDNGSIEIESAIEGEAVRCRKCETVEDCGDLNKEMNLFISKYIL